jgi:hypothetical protein
VDGISTEGHLLPQHYSDPIISSLHSSHLVLEAIGHEAVEEFIEEFVQNQLLPYDKQGGIGGSLYCLDKDSLEKRLHATLP